MLWAGILKPVAVAVLGLSVIKLIKWAFAFWRKFNRV